MDRVLAADARAGRSRQRLRTRYGVTLRSWATARAAEWQLPAAPTITDVVSKLDRLCTNEVWARLTGSADVQAIDQLMRSRLWAFVSARRRRPKSEQIHELTIGEISNIVRIWFPKVTRARLRTLLFRATRARQVFQMGRGVYTGDGWRAWERARDAADAAENPDDDERTLRVAVRERRAAIALALHYLLPRVPVYRKAKALGMSDRNFHYAIDAVIAEIAEDLEWQRKLRRREKCAALNA